MIPPSEGVLKRFDVAQPLLIEETGIANIWKVIRKDGSPAALKTYLNGDMKNEAAGFDYLSSLKGCGAAHVLQVESGAALMEWLDGPSLGDMARTGKDLAAAELVAQTARKLHFPAPKSTTSLPTMAQIFADLLEADIPQSWPINTKSALKHAQSLARHLLATSPAKEPLHGDLHHDNIRLGGRGYCAFDAKGILGERSYELANAVRNPLGMEQEIRSSDRIDAVSTLYASALEVPLKRFRQMTAVKCGLSICWRLGSKKADHEADLLELLLEKAAN